MRITRLHNLDSHSPAIELRSSDQYPHRLLMNSCYNTKWQYLRMSVHKDIESRFDRIRKTVVLLRAPLRFFGGVLDLIILAKSNKLERKRESESTTGFKQ